MPKADFPIFQKYPQLVYLDSAATTQLPASVIAAEKEFYEAGRSSAHRGTNLLAEKATLAYEAVREECQGFINAGQVEEIVFTENATEALNIVAYIESIQVPTYFFWAMS